MCIYFPQYVLQSQLNKATHTRLCKTSMLYLGPSLSHTLGIYNNMCKFKREGAHHMWSSTVARGDPKAQADIHSAEHDSTNLWGVGGLSNPK